MTKDELLTKISEIQLVCIEINLFLDTHPDCMQAMMDYNAYSKELRELMNKYVCEYGPLIGFGHDPISKPDAWMSSPWPWDNCNCMNKEERY